MARNSTTINAFHLAVVDDGVAYVPTAGLGMAQSPIIRPIQVSDALAVGTKQGPMYLLPSVNDRIRHYKLVSMLGLDLRQGHPPNAGLFVMSPAAG